MGLNDLLFDPIRHNNWATGSLIEFCRAQNLTADQLDVTGVGTYGGILATRVAGAALGELVLGGHLESGGPTGDRLLEAMLANHSAKLRGCGTVALSQ